MSSVFSSQYSGQYDTLYRQKNYVGECNLIERIWAREASEGATLLDVGCGTGSHLIEFARRGYECTGIDLSPSMIEEARQKASRSRLDKSPQWQVADARSFRTGTTYDKAIMMFAVVGYLTTNDEVLSGLRNIRRHLKLGGIFICDFWYGPAVLAVRPNERVRLLDDGERKTLRAAATTVDSFNHTADVNFRLWSVEGDKFLGETNEVHRMRYFFPQEFRLLLQTAGFDMVSLDEFPSGAPLSDQSWNAICTAKAI